MAETVEIVTSMWSQPETTYEGKYFRLERAQCDPKPVQSPRPPVWIGGGGEQLTLRVVARLADWANWGGSPTVGAKRRSEGHCKVVGRTRGIGKSWSPEVLVRESEPRSGRWSTPAGPGPVGRGLRLLGRRQPGRHARAGHERSPATWSWAAPTSSPGARLPRPHHAFPLRRTGDTGVPRPTVPPGAGGGVPPPRRWGVGWSGWGGRGAGPVRGGGLGGCGRACRLGAGAGRRGSGGRVPHRSGNGGAVGTLS